MLTPSVSMVNSIWRPLRFLTKERLNAAEDPIEFKGFAFKRQGAIFHGGKVNDVVQDRKEIADLILTSFHVSPALVHIVFFAGKGQVAHDGIEGFPRVAADAAHELTFCFCIITGLAHSRMQLGTALHFKALLIIDAAAQEEYVPMMAAPFFHALKQEAGPMIGAIPVLDAGP